MAITKLVRVMSLFFALLLGLNSVTSAQSTAIEKETDAKVEERRQFKFFKKTIITGSTLRRSAWKENEISVRNMHGQAFYVFDVNNNVTCWLLGFIVNGPLSLTGDGLATFKEVGEYQIAGDSVQIKFRHRSITATVNVSEIKGFIIHEGADKKQEWKIQNTSAEDNRRLQELGILSNTNESPKPGTLSSPTSLPRTLRLGTYEFAGTETATFGSGMSLPVNAKMSVKIETINPDGYIKAELDRGGYKGQLKGRVDPKGDLQLEGSYLDEFWSKWTITLKPIVQDKTLINGKYIVVNGRTGSKGVFNIALLENDN